jgi:hypothetical protein
MKHLSILALVAAFSLGIAGNVTQRLSYSPASLELGTEQGYTTVGFAGFPRTEKLGAPALPVIPLQVVIPPTAEVTGFEVTDLQEEPVSGTFDVIPVQYPQAWMENSKQFPFVEPSSAYYTLNAAYPARAAEFVATGTKAGYRLAGFRVYPVRYNPVTKQLSVVTRLTVKVIYAEQKVHARRYSEMQIAMHGGEVSRLVLNPSAVSRWAPPKKTMEFGSAFLPAGTYEHVILAANAYKDSLARLRDWRTRQGWRSIIVPIESVCAVYPGVDTAEQMRNFLKDAETTWSTIFCFIAREDWPAQQYRRAYGSVSGYPVDFFPSDWYFGCLDGSWNADGDTIWGEPNDSVDCLSDIHIGMITLDGFTELSNYLDKVFRYEFTPDTGWFNKSLLGNDVTFSNEYNDSIAEATPSPPWFDLKMYVSGGMVSPTVQGYCDSLESGYPITAVIAHGAVDLYGMGGNITSPIMNGLTNTNRMSMFTGVCCHTGAWDEVGNTNGDCIAENMAFHAPAGFVGVDMNTRYGWVAVAEYFNYSICYGLLGFRTARTITQGEALSYGKDYWHGMVAVTTDTSKFRWEAYERTLFGEPAVPIWMDKAIDVSVTKPSVINIGAGVPVDITVNSADGPVDSAMVCLVKGTETFARGFTNASGEITLMVSPLTPGALQLTVSCANNIPCLDSIQVISTGTYVTYLKSRISDPPPGGNGDSVINPGESFRIPTWVKNYGTQTATGVTGRLGTATAGVTITDSIKSFGNVPGGDSVQNTEGFGMTVASNLPDGYTIRCSLTLKDATDSTWKSYATFTVGAPELAYAGWQVIDTIAGGNGNGRLDANERAQVVVMVRDTGFGNAHNVTGVLISGDSRLVIEDSAADFGTIMADSIGGNNADPFVVHTLAIPPELPLPCTLRLTCGGQTWTFPFTIVGEISQYDPVPDGPREPAAAWAYDDVDVVYAHHPVFNWYEINARGTSLYLANDESDFIQLPFTWKIYGQSDDYITICSNGWVAPGNQSSIATPDNTALPGAAVPGMVAVNWDDLNPEAGGTIYVYNDALRHRYIVEWDNVAYAATPSVTDKFQVMIYDQTVSTPSGDNLIIMQYLTANGYGSSTVGMQNMTTDVGINCLFNGSYHQASAPIVANRAIKFTSEVPGTGVVEPDHGASLAPDKLALTLTPNPSRGAARIAWQLPVGGVVRLNVYDVGGRSVRTLVNSQTPAGRHVTAWDGRDDLGRVVPQGLYVCKLQAAGRTLIVRSVLLR